MALLEVLIKQFSKYFHNTKIKVELIGMTTYHTCAWTYRSTEHESTKFSPNKLILGRKINSPLDFMVGQPSSVKSEQCYVQFVEWV